MSRGTRGGTGWRARRSSRVTALGLAVAWLGSVGPVGAQRPAAYEEPPTLRASDLVPAERLRGPGFQVDEAVPTDGFLATFTIRTDQGAFTARGPGMLEIRLGEIAAIRQLDAMAKSDVFVQGLKSSATELGNEVRQLATNPAETVKGIPEGVGRFFERVGRGAKTGVQKLSALKAEQDAPAPPPPGPGAQLPGERPGGARPEVSVTGEAARAVGRVTRDAFGYDDKRRELAKQVHVDPYTTTPSLVTRLDDVAWAAFAGGLGITGLVTVAPASMLISTSTMLTDWVYDTPPGDLKVQNEKALRAMGVPQEAVDHLLRQTRYTLTLQTALVRSLERLKGVAGRPDVMPLVLTVESEEQARFVVGSLTMLARYHETVAPLARLDLRGTVVGREKAGGGLVIAAPVDLLAWTARLHRFATRSDLKAGRRGLWLSGEATSLARQKLIEAGWEVHARSLADPR